MISFVKDPIYREVEIPQEYSFINELLNTREMKRLKYILQLGECFNVFFNAVHTRYSHSIGVYRNAMEIIKSLNVKINEYDRKIIVAAALLHDVGHGPRSHCFEGWTGHKHEIMTQKIILTNTTEVNQVLRKHNLKPEDVIKIINHESEKKFHSQIVSSQIDADRLDYLLRDSYFVGANYGLVDSGLLIKWMDVVDDNLCFNPKAIGLIEKVLFSRAQMFREVYTNSKVIVYQQILKLLFKRYKELALKKYPFKDQYHLYYLLSPYVNNKEWTIDLFLELDDNKLNLIIESWLHEQDEILSKLAYNYLFQMSYYCLKEPNDKLKLVSKFDEKFVFYNEKEKIYINQDGKLVALTDLKSEFLLINNKTKYKFSFYIYKK